MIDLAFLAPDIIRDVLDGKQPVGFYLRLVQDSCASVRVGCTAPHGRGTLTGPFEHLAPRNCQAQTLAE